MSRFLQSRTLRHAVALACLALLPAIAALPAVAQTGNDGVRSDDPARSGPGYHEHRSPDGEIDVNVCSYDVAPETAHCNARIRTDFLAQIAGAAAGASASGAAPLVSAPGSAAYGPAELQSAYATPSSTGGAGRTVAIVDAYDNPNAEADLAAYRSAYGLSACTTASGCFRKVNQNGGSTVPAANAGWATEISLDLQMVSATCPNCNILLVEATSNSFANLGTAVNRAVTMGAVAVSNSYGGGEFSSETAADATYFDHPGVAITVSSGDAGYGVEYPAASHYVTAVGGTSLTRTPTGFTEKAWSGAGSGCSAFETKPTWQTDGGCSRRSVADVSAVADPATGVWVYDTYGGRGWAIYGGTSVSAPIVAAVYALGGGGPATDYPGAYPYAHVTSLHDVTAGANGSCGGTYLCTALTGYDGPTGLGTPNGTDAFAAAPAAPAFTIAAAPAALTLAAGASGSANVTLTPSGGFSGPVTLTTSVAPSAGVTATAPSSVGVSGTTTATLGLQAVSPGTYTVTVTATSGSLVRSTTVTVTVPSADFTLTASPSSRTVSRGSQTAYTVTVTRSGGFTGAIALGVTGQQTSDTATFSPNPIGSGANSATLTVKTNKLDSRTTRTLTITGTGSGKTHTATVSLTYR